MKQQKLKQLQDCLAKVRPGPIKEDEEGDVVTSALCEVWEDLDGSDAERTDDSKLCRIENLHWEPPYLWFELERHGGTCMGSTRAAIHKWSVDVKNGQAWVDTSGYRQIHPMDKPLDVRPIADKAAAAIIGCDSGAVFLKWIEEGRDVRVKLKELISHAGYQRTIQGRRKRLKKALAERLEGTGWVEKTPNRYVRAD